MPYLVQKMSSGTLPPKTYYRRQTTEHSSHDETGRFTQDAKRNYAEFNHISEDQVEVGTFRSGQGIPTDKGTFEI
ncbi:hypothetical protein CDG77_25760 [Nostoc sp. 'Peltigera membranacea cyanobiont' 213]|uniref:hypothetical protein n=1 Tax=Nostoc sp. 'Peltigera membranacea cyanobiont' 213 TaxID=2014530 RepID=UPI000B95047E|nr:hypothetical protein [Nostoc sp. 'Peltigera membranacea cyanobiont' 213]OYD88073.1 hypothetical protein CDG77_25760 [Nostoc sp. 'Peltigera membranacea cyanobiont' 213]